MWKLRLVTVTRQGLLARAGRRGWLRWAEIAAGHLEHARRACSWTASLRMLAGQHLPNRDCMRTGQKQAKQAVVEQCEMWQRKRTCVGS